MYSVGQQKYVCKNCNKRFGDRHYAEKRTFCSVKCKAKYQKKFTGDKCKFWNGGGIKKQCEICGKDFTVTRYRRDIARFCSKECHIAHQKTLTGEKSIAWKGGFRYKYPPGFNNKLKKEIRERYGNICQGCGKTQEQEMLDFGKSLCVHHIDYDMHNLQEYNLIPVCTTCNVIANARTQREKWIEYYRSKVIGLK